MVPAGYVTSVRTEVRPEPRQEAIRNGDRDVKSQLPQPMPISLVFWAGPGDEPRSSSFHRHTRPRRTIEFLRRSSVRFRKSGAPRNSRSQRRVTPVRDTAHFPTFPITNTIVFIFRIVNESVHPVRAHCA